MSYSEPVQFVQITTDELAKLIDQKISDNLNNFKKEFLSKEADDELLTREQTAEFLQVDVSTLYLWAKKGKIKPYGIGKRRYYKRSELIECLTQIRQLN
ncbi:helix-turn-helix domain-containing protein [Psychroflexus planctonicus]|uniref:DNA-binding protein n=1 Tax=Psychroflexus planctonicus TaxID=1526575 RepID=A0ABQ1SDT5_9FLAO|nr:helix-turn-helix domain-containing protein [Psychroflexus planctonicus]GGE25567.1 DNA-binding protein [Psychroflexus planctonicus]